MRRKQKSSRPFRALEQLESRLLMTTISIAANGKSLTYTDVDSDVVSIKITRGDLQTAIFDVGDSGSGEILYGLDLTNAGFAGTDVAVTVKKSAAGDGLVNIGVINADGNDLGAVSIAGDLGFIIAGDAVTPAVGIKSLAARSIGRLGLDTQIGGPALPLFTDITGTLGSLTIKGDVKDAIINVTGTTGALTVTGSLDGASLISTGDMGLVKIGGDVVGATDDQTGFISSTNGKIAGVTIAGSLIGGDGADSGKIKAGTTLGTTKISGDVVGGTGSFSGSVYANSNMASVAVGGSLIGGTTSTTGSIFSFGTAGVVSVAHDIVGGSGINSGYIQTDGKSLTIGGSIIGGTNTDAGVVFFQGSSDSIKVAHNIVGGSGANSGKLAGSTCKTASIGGSVIGGSGDYSGIVVFSISVTTLNIAGNIVGGSASGAVHLYQSGALLLNTLGTLNLSGSLRAGTDNSSSFVLLCGAIIVNGSASAINIKGSMIGTIGASGDAVAAVIRTNSIGFKSLKIGGRMERALVLGGFQEHEFTLGDPISNDVQFGAITIGGDMIASSIVAGAQNTASNNLFFGNNNDAVMPAGNPSLSSAIASVTIGGQVYGTPSSISNSDHFGIVSESIGALKIGGAAVTLDPFFIFTGLNIGPTGDFAVHQVG